MSRSGSRKLPTATLFAQTFLLTVLGLVLAQIVNIWIIFHLPRPAPEFFTAAEIGRALRQGPGQISVGDRHLLVHRSPQLSVDRDLFVTPGLGRVRREVAEATGATPSSVVVAVEDARTDRFLPRRGRSGDPRPDLERRGLKREAPFLLSPFNVAVRQTDGTWLIAETPRAPLLNRWQTRIALWFLVTSLALAPVAWLFARRLSSSVTLFAEAAERLGRDPNAAPLPAKGPREIAPAIAAFNEMQDRLRRYVSDRTTMAAAMAHDLRTPLTRLRFRVEAAPPDLRAKLVADVEEMEAMVGATLAYVRDAYGGAERTRLELSSLVQSVVDDLAEIGAPVVLETSDRIVIEGDPTALRRLLTNLIENACKFGGAARTRLRAEPREAVIEVDDDGPGIAEVDLPKVFEPFFRVEPSRSRETGGSGLGLAAARSIARMHGGEVTLVNRPGGGLTAQVRLPA